MKTVDDLFKEYFSDFEVEPDIIRGLYVIKRGDREYGAITMRSILCHGKEYRAQQHRLDCITNDLDFWPFDECGRRYDVVCDCPWVTGKIDMEPAFRGLRQSILRKMTVGVEQS